MNDYSRGPTVQGDANSSASEIEVCDKCLRACCWQGVLMCDESQTAGTVMKCREELERLDLEHSDYWDGADE